MTITYKDRRFIRKPLLIAVVTAVRVHEDLKAFPPVSIDIRLVIHSAGKQASKQFILPTLCFLNIM